MADIQMVDLKKQYARIKSEIDQAVLDVIASSRYIKGPVVQAFEEELAHYLDVKHVIGCANGTDALQVALMALGLKPGDEVIVPSFTYVATAEVIALLGLTPVMIDVDPHHFNVTANLIRPAITPRTKAIVPVHLFGQTAPMEEIMDVATEHGLYVIEDNAQAIGADYTFSDGKSAKAGTIGHIGTTSFFPSKNLGCYGDGGAIFTNDDDLAANLKMIANHGQSKRYYHDRVGVNSRLDAMQAAILRVKLPHLDDYCARRRQVANAYTVLLETVDKIAPPQQVEYSSHVFHQFTMMVPAEDRSRLIDHLKQDGIPSMIYYPVPLYKQKAFVDHWPAGRELPITEQLCDTVMSLPIHTEMDEALVTYIGSSVLRYFS
ncbi:MAG: DegT/DnrJ/EryC1/StrS family aminotransferase [Saprospiraceae bacterium]|nr:DegT/DnrJ/EryC1/StrS family aminotransferase [Saprospiraceae bacterium]